MQDFHRQDFHSTSDDKNRNRPVSHHASQSVHSIMDTKPATSCIFVYCFMALVVLAFGAIFARLLWLQLYQHDLLSNRVAARTLQTVAIDAKRGNILDRNHEILAMSLPMYRLIVDPVLYQNNMEHAQYLADLTGLDMHHIQQQIAENQGRRYVILQKDVPPDIHMQFTQSPLPGVYLEKYNKRFYPHKEIIASLIGYTNYNNEGQEGVESAYQEYLRGIPGKEKVVKNGQGNIIKRLGMVTPSKPGHNLQLSIDINIQHITYHALKKAIDQYDAQKGSAVVIDLENNQLLAMANYPSFNPNNRSKMDFDLVRNQAIADLFEPGSTLKPLVVAAALETGLFDIHSQIDVSSGKIQIQDKLITDARPLGTISLAEIIAKSSNVGISKLAMQLGQNPVLSMYQHFGLGMHTGTTLPGEQEGYLPLHPLSDLELATLSYGYGISMNILQLANIYSVFGSGGFWSNLSFVLSPSKDKPIKTRSRILSQKTTDQVLQALRQTVEDGTGKQAYSAIYTTAGKTGTAYKAQQGHYQKDKYTATFVGIAPVTNPRIVAAVLIHEPSGGYFHGGQVAAPVFKSIIEASLPLLGTVPDRLMANHHASFRYDQGY